MKLTIKQIFFAILLSSLVGSHNLVASNPQVDEIVSDVLITCFIKVDQEGHLSLFIGRLCEIITTHKAYFKEKYPHFDIDQLLRDLNSIKQETRILTIQEKLKKYWDLLPQAVRDTSFIKLAVNMRKRVTAAIQA